MCSHRRTLAAACHDGGRVVSLYPMFTGWLWFWAGLGSITVVARGGHAHPAAAAAESRPASAAGSRCCST